MRRLAMIAALSLAGCGPMLTAMGGGTPPQAPSSFTNISRSAIDFALNSFDAALYGLDFAMDSHLLVPGSAQAHQLATAGRKVMGFLGAADAAQKLGSSPTYEAAFSNATAALADFRALLPAHPATMVSGNRRPPLTNAQRLSILDRLDRGGPTT